MRLTLKSEPVSPTGSISSVGILNQLGRPKLDTLAVLIRETVQNSWDARLSDDAILSYIVHGWQLLPSQRQVLSEQVFSVRPPLASLSMTLFDSAEPLLGLIIADRGTTGLEGPTRADVVPEGSPRRFISFLRDIGQPSNQNLSGGTYGYGKASLYLASGMKTILVHTRCKLPNGQLESRFIAAALGQRWADESDRQFTGRHWWGRDGGDAAEPILDRDADDLAAALGMGGFTDDETGTTILILDPLLNDRSTSEQLSFEAGERTSFQAFNLMAEYILWFFWPKMLDSGSGHPSIQFQLQWEETPINIPHPKDFPPLRGFVEAMDRLKGRGDDESFLRAEVQNIDSERPRQHLGTLALQRFFVQKETVFDTGSTNSLFEGITHHTALMRQAELVVKYLEGRLLANNSIGYAGVFITDPLIDTVFAKSEPPTHDDWSPDSLTDKWHKTYVRVALRDIKSQMASFAQAPRTIEPQGMLTPLGAFATWLGESLIPMETGTAASRPRQRPNISLPTFLVRSDRASTPAQPSSPSTFSKNDDAGKALIGSNPTPVGTMVDTLPINSLPNNESSENNQPESANPNLTSGEDSDLNSPSPRENPPPAPTFPTTTLAKLEPKQFTRKPIRGHSSAEIIYDELVEYEHNPALLITFNVRHAENADGTSITLKAQAVLDSDRIEDEPPVGGSMVQVARWISPAGDVFANSDGNIFISVLEPREKWQVLVWLPGDIMANIELEAKAEAQA